MNVELFDGNPDLLEEIAFIHGSSIWDTMDSRRRSMTTEVKIQEDAAVELQKALSDNRGKNIILLCKTNEGLISGLLWMEITTSKLYGDKTGYILDIFVKKDFRRLGIADLMLETAQQELKKRDIGRMSLNVSGNNRSALEMYRKHSFSTETIRLSKRI